MKKTLVLVLIMLAAVASTFAQESGMEFYVQNRNTMYVLPGEMVIGQFGIQPTIHEHRILAVRADFYKSDLAEKFNWSNPDSRVNVSWNPVNESRLEQEDLGSLYFDDSESLGAQRFAWYSNDGNGLEFLFLFAMDFVNIAPVGTVADGSIYVNAVLSDQTLTSTSSLTRYETIDGIMGDVNDDKSVDKKDVDLLAFYEPSWIDLSGRYVREGLNFGRACIAGSVPTMLDVYFLNVFVNDPRSPIVAGLGIGEPMSMRHGSLNGAAKITGRIQHNIPFIESIAGKSLTVETAGNVVSVFAFMPDGKIWRDAKFTQNGRVSFSVPDSNLEYRIEATKIPYGQDFTTGIMELPNKFSLGQNYPNPFNPSTTIPFNLTESGHVRLNIYNSAGQLVGTLVNGIMNAGKHEISWKPDNRLASGAYLIRLEVSGKIENRRIMFTK